MNKTDNYQLNQWEKTDRIMMEDFNRDNAEIDAALAAEKAERISSVSTTDAALRTLVGEKQAFQPLFSLTTSQQAQMVELELSELDISQYFLIFLRLQASNSVVQQVFFNDISNQISAFLTDMNGAMGCSAFSKEEGAINLLLMPCKNPDDSVKTFFTVKGKMSLGVGEYRTLTWGGVNKLIWKSHHYNNPATYVGAGSKMTIWGVK